MDVRKKKILEVSYSYIEYPGESTHSIKSYMDTLSKTIIKTYDSINVDVRFTDNGILSYEWGFNGDSNSYTADRKEVWSPLDSNVIPDQLNYFSHLFSIRTNKDDSYYGGTNGGGSSRG